jgi:hypothetical protein
MVTKSRFGFHPCDYQTYRKLKTLYKRFWQTKHAVSAWQRWNNKLPKNRVIRKWIRDEQGRKIGFEVVGKRPEPKFCPLFMLRKGVNHPAYLNGQIASEYQKARTPRPENQVVALGMFVDEIDKLYREVEEWFALHENREKM